MTTKFKSHVDRIIASKDLVGLESQWSTKPNRNTVGEYVNKRKADIEDYGRAV